MQVNAASFAASQVRSARPAGARAGAVSGPRIIDAVATEERDDQRASASAAARRERVGESPSGNRPADVLYVMFEQMGGAATSVWKGMHVNTVI